VTRARHRWLSPVLILSAVAVAAFGGLYSLDRWQAHAGSGWAYFDFAPERISDAIGSLANMIAAVLGIVITVVSIIVQLSASRYAQVTEMFFRDRTNMTVLAFYVIGCMSAIFVSFSLGHGDFVPRVTLTVMMVVAMIAFALMAPYFAYVFDFLSPPRIIGRIRDGAQRAARRGMGEAGARDRSQAAALAGVEQLADITVNSIGGKDKIIATAGVDALKDLAVAYLTDKKASQPGWFAIGPSLAKNPDFVSMSAESLRDLEAQRSWLEFKVLRQYQAIYGEALTHMRDINSVIAIDTRYVAEAAIAAGDAEALRLAVKFFNTFLRATINVRDVRTAYNVLHQYRLLAEAVLRAGQHDRAVELAGFLKYYGHLGFSMKLAFVTETVAYDLCTLCEVAHGLRSPAESRLLAIFLEVDQPEHDDQGEAGTGLRGVRKAQVKLATYYLVVGAPELARRIWDDMSHERGDRLRSIHDELASVEAKDFWEIIDRGTNFDYLPPERKAALATFFAFGPRQGVAKEEPAS
jgi:hypothetical protein